MKDRIEYRFTLDAYSPETIPMARLAEYMSDLATLLGERSEVHFVRLDPGSTVLVSAVEREAEPKVQRRLDAVRTNDGPQEALEAFARIDNRLLDDNATGSLVAEPGVRILQFPGRLRAAQPKYGPFNEPGSIQGQVIVVGGKRDAVSVHIQDGDRTWRATAPRDLARKLAQHIFGPTIRAIGIGRWFRDGEGAWTQTQFVIRDFEILSDESLPDVLAQLRAVRADWTSLDDPLEELKRLRTGEDN